VAISIAEAMDDRNEHLHYCAQAGGGENMARVDLVQE